MFLVFSSRLVQTMEVQTQHFMGNLGMVGRNRVSLFEVQWGSKKQTFKLWKLYELVQCGCVMEVGWMVSTI